MVILAHNTAELPLWRFAGDISQEAYIFYRYDEFVQVDFGRYIAYISATPIILFHFVPFTRFIVRLYRAAFRHRLYTSVRAIFQHFSAALAFRQYFQFTAALPKRQMFAGYYFSYI